MPVTRANTTNHEHFEASGSRTEGGRAGRRRRRRTRHQHGQTPPSDQPQSRLQQILNPGNLLRRLLPSSSLFNSDSQPSWIHKAGQNNLYFADKIVETVALCWAWVNLHCLQFIELLEVQGETLPLRSNQFFHHENHPRSLLCWKSHVATKRKVYTVVPLGAMLWDDFYLNI